MSKIKVQDFWRLFTGYTSGKAQTEDVQSRTLVFITIITVLTTVSFSVVNYLYAREWLALVLLITTFTLLPCFLIKRDIKYLEYVKPYFMVNTVFVLMALFVDGGIENTAFMWTLVFPFAAFLIMGLPVGWFWVAAYMLLMIGFIVAHFNGSYQLPYPNEYLIFFPSSFLFFSLISAIFELHIERLQMRYEGSIEELEELRANLEKSVEARTAALIRSNDTLIEEMKNHKQTSKALKESEERFYHAQKMEAVGTLAGGIAHDFNNMLAGMNANLFIMKNKMQNNPEILKRLGNIEQLVLNAADMVKQLMTFARKDDVEYKALNLKPFLKEAYKLARMSISEEVNVSYQDKSDALYVRANTTQLQQVLMNLMNNARDAVNGIEEPKIEVRLNEYHPCKRFRKKFSDLTEHVYARICVIDNGNGIAEEDLSKVFEPFFTTKEVDKGTGLGLAMSYGVIQGHHGAMEVQSTVGKGTVFKIYLPLVESESSEQLMETTGIHPISVCRTVMLVDDDHLLRMSQKDALESMGYNIIDATNGVEAVALFQQNEADIDIIVMDLTMPKMGGVKAAEKIRQIRPDVPIIFVTGYDKDDSVNGYPAFDGKECLLSKPFSMKKLFQEIQARIG